MRVLHLAAGNRWTGAAAPAFAEVEALRAEGIDAHYAYVGGYKLQDKLQRVDFAHPIIAKAQNPRSFVRSVEAIRALLRHHRFDLVHAHLTYDHWLARFAIRGTPAKLARTFHARRVLRSDPATAWLLRRTDAVFVINHGFLETPGIGARAFFTPPPLDHRQFAPEGHNVREAYGLGPEAKVIAVIGKLSRDRGFEAALETFARVRKGVAEARLMVIGHGEHRPALEGLASRLGVGTEVIWAGYHEADLAEHYRAADGLLFTARGSDEGHRAVLEAMACGAIPAVFPLEGMPALLGPLAPRLMAADATPHSLAGVVTAILRAEDDAALRRRVQERSLEFAYPRAAQRLLSVYGSLV